MTVICVNPCSSVAFRKNQFQRALSNWYRKNGRDLPWRRTRDPYRILISEFMLQQTQVVTVLPYYRNWLRRFPTLRALARASESQVLHAWQGLGYYARARNLHQSAKLVARQHRGRFPRSVGQMRTLPGIGRYTAHAIATFAFDQLVPIVETNTARVLSRLFDLQLPIDSSRGRAKLWEHAAALVPKKSSSDYNSALVDLGAVVCLPHKPNCRICPVKRFCSGKEPQLLPVKRPRRANKRLTERHAFVLNKDKLLLTRSADRWRGMWILPAFNGNLKRKAAIYRSVFPFTNHRITLKVFRQRARTTQCRDQRWFSKGELVSTPIPSPHRRAIEQLIANA